MDLAFAVFGGVKKLVGRIFKKFSFKIPVKAAGNSNKDKEKEKEKERKV